jgi:hypothetical protein
MKVTSLSKANDKRCSLIFIIGTLNNVEVRIDDKAILFEESERLLLNNNIETKSSIQSKWLMRKSTIEHNRLFVFKFNLLKRNKYDY